jgi:hypothetical protein
VRSSHRHREQQLSLLVEENNDTPLTDQCESCIALYSYVCVAVFLTFFVVLVVPACLRKEQPTHRPRGLSITAAHRNHKPCVFLRLTLFSVLTFALVPSSSYENREWICI